MKLLALLLCLVVLSAATQDQELLLQQFANFMVKYNKSYATESEFQQRLSIFELNVNVASQLNELSSAQGPLAATYGVTEFMDFHPDDFKKYFLMSNFDKNDLPNLPYLEVKGNLSLCEPFPGLQDSIFDWRSKGVVTNVYNQGQCGSCWAFSVAETLESMYAIAGKGLINLSMQQLVDCDRTTNDHGCNGGTPAGAWAYIHSVGGLDTYQSYPYRGNDGPCSFNRNTIGANFGSWGWVSTNDNEQAMYNFLTQKGPMSVCLDASQWQYYTGGVVMRGTCTTNIDHCVELIGVDMNIQNSGVNAWIIRNSWGTNWGYSGYIYLETGYNVCGVGQVASSVQI